MTYGVDELRRDFLVTDARSRVFYLNGPKQPLPHDMQHMSCSIAIGAFDGVHLGHQHLLAQTVADARSRGISAVAVTFDPDPDVVVSKHPAPKLTTLDDRLNLLAASGVDAVAVVSFTHDVAAMDHIAFFESVLAPALDVRSAHVGQNFRLGAGGASTVETIKAWGATCGIEVYGHDLVREGDRPVSATRIRGLIGEGRAMTAADELGRAYMVRGVVERGRGEGHKLGFPTANVLVPSLLAVPREGVYAGFACVDATAWPAAINVGLPPTFKDCEGSAKLEASLVGFSDDIYGKEIAISFTELLRPSRPFASIDELIATVKGNIEDVTRMYGDRGRVLSR